MELCDNYDGDSMNKKYIGNIIKYMRVNRNLTQEQLAEKINIGRTTLSDYEREKTDINFETIQKICNICNFEIVFKDISNGQNINIEEIQRKF